MHKTILPIGPQHPSLKEPIYLELEVDGTEVYKANFNLGYAHRGVEKALEGLGLDPGLHSVQRTCGICSYCHGFAFMRAVEDIAGIMVNDRVKLQRVILAEMERIHSHLVALGFMLHELGLETLFMYFWREREHILDVFDELTGNRVQHSADLIGTMKMGFTREDVRFCLEKLELIQNEIKDLTEVLMKNEVIRSRTVGKGIISAKTINEFGLVGPVARSSGVDRDIRIIDPYGAYKEVGLKSIVKDGKDAWTRTIIKCEEIFESTKAVKKACEMIPFDQSMPKKLWKPVPDGHATGRVEAPRGENFHFIMVEGNKIKRAKIKTPTLSNVIYFSKILEGVDITDVPILIMSMDPCISCMDRVAVIKDGKREEWTSHELTQGKKNV